MCVCTCAYACKCVCAQMSACQYVCMQKCEHVQVSEEGMWSKKIPYAQSSDHLLVSLQQQHATKTNLNELHSNLLSLHLTDVVKRFSNYLKGERKLATMNLQLT